MRIPFKAAAIAVAALLPAICDAASANKLAVKALAQAPLKTEAGSSASVQVLQSLSMATGTQPTQIIAGPNGVYYGIDYIGGTAEGGVLFQVDANGNYKILFNFTGSSGSGPASLVLGSNGDLYGTGDQYTDANSHLYFGFVFHYSPTTQAYEVLHAFNNTLDGESPRSLIQGSDGNLYGTTLTSGPFNSGTVFKLVPGTGAFSTVYAFNYNKDNTGEPEKIMQYSDGNFYGVNDDFITTGVGQIGYGTVFQLTPAGVMSVIHSFSGRDGSLPITTLVDGGNGYLYGTTEDGGSGCPSSVPQNAGCGTVYRITTAGSFQTLHSFNRLDGSLPTVNLVLNTDGNFYGATDTGGTLTGNCHINPLPTLNGCGVFYSISPTGSFTQIYNFSYNQGTSPSTIVPMSASTFLGGMQYGGTSGYGSVYELTTK